MWRVPLFASNCAILHASSVCTSAAEVGHVEGAAFCVKPRHLARLERLHKHTLLLWQMGLP